MAGADTHRVAGIGPLHLGEAPHVGVEHVHLLHQGCERRLGGLTDLLINTFGLRGQRTKRKSVPWAPGPWRPPAIPTFHLEGDGSKPLPSSHTQENMVQGTPFP